MAVRLIAKKKLVHKILMREEEPMIQRKCVSLKYVEMNKLKLVRTVMTKVSYLKMVAHSTVKMNHHTNNQITNSLIHQSMEHLIHLIHL